LTVRYLLDTHTFAWAVGAPELLSERVRALLTDPNTTPLVSAASTWEMSIKHHLGKWPEVAPFLDEGQYRQFLRRLRASELPINHSHARLAGQLTMDHCDPFDRMLAAQALLEGVPLISKDAQLDLFPSARLW
jgi:PIN domain nuclease of toxin-antitoxin system